MEKNVSDILLEELDLLQKEIIDNHERAGQVATGKTKASISHFLINPYHGVLTGPTYIGVLETGRGPAKGKGSGTSNFLDNLKQWIMARWVDIKDVDDLERKAKFLKWWINKNGTWAFRKKEHHDIFTTAIDKFTKRITERISKYYLVEVTNEIQNNK